MSTDTLSPIWQARQCCIGIETALRDLKRALLSEDHTQAHALDGAIEAFTAAAASLGQPSLKLSMVGTTSAGKSTLLDGIIGRRICPIDSNELSAGLLTITQAASWSMLVEDDHAPDFARCTEDAVHDFLKDRMSVRIKSRRRGEDERDPHAGVFARYQVRAPLFPATEGHDFHQQTDGRLGQVFHDLPGLRTLDDRENLRVIQDAIRRSICLVVLDYSTLYDREKREKIYEEVADTVRCTGDQMTLVVFALNRVDRRDADDRPLAATLAELEQDIATKLALDAEVKLHPTWARGLYFGSRILMALLDGDEARAQSLRADSKKDCWGHLSNLLEEEVRGQRGDKEAMREAWQARIGRLRKIEEDLFMGFDSAREDLKWLGQQLVRHSGHAEIWEVLVRRLEQNVDVLVIAPEVRSPLKQLNSTVKGMRGYLRGRLAENEAEIERRLGELATLEAEVKEQIGAERAAFAEQVQKLMVAVHEGGDDPREVMTLMEELGANRDRHEHLMELNDLLNDLVGKLEAEVLEPLQDHMQRHLGELALCEAFEKGVGGSHAADLADAWGRMTRCGYSRSRAADGHARTLKNPSAELKSELRDLHKATADLYLATRAILTQRAEYKLQIRAGVIGADVGKLANDNASGIWKRLRARLWQGLGGNYLEDLDIERADLPPATELSLPEDVLTIAGPAVSSTRTEKEETGHTYQDPSASCFKGHRIPIKEDVEYLDVVIPSAAEHIRTLTDGIRHERLEFWHRFADWFDRQLTASMDHVEHQFDRYLKAVRAGLAARMEEINQEGEARRQEWGAIEGQVDELARKGQILKDLGGLVAP